MAKAKKLKITLVRSIAGRRSAQKACVHGLGLRRIRHSVLVDNTVENRGMINRVNYLLRVEEA